MFSGDGPGIRVKICCIASRAEIELATAQGADALGFVSEMPSGPGVLADALINELVPQVPSSVESVLLTSGTSPTAIIRQQRACGATALQLCNPLPHPALFQLRAGLPGVSLIHVVHVCGEESVAEARQIAGLVDALLLDTGKREGAERQLGGTGRTHDWSLSARIVAEAGVPVLLAGGLNPDNVAEAILRVQPAGVDICSGIRIDGLLDEKKLVGFMKAVNAASC